jgi:type I restriction enzyme M protein
MGELVTLIGNVDLGHDADTARDLLGRTYEYFIKAFAKAEGHRGGEFFTPQSVVRLLVAMLEPFEGRVFDPAAGSCGMFIQSAKFVEAHGGKARNVALYGQESAMTNYRIGRMNLALHGLSGDIRGGESSLTNDQHPTLRADFVLANPPFNQKEWGAEKVRGDSRWKYGEPPGQNANFAWIQHFVSHLAPTGRAGFVMANGSLASATNGEDKIREALVRQGLVDCIVACPTQLFFTTQIPVSLWFLDRRRAASRESVLLIDARKLSAKISATQREFTGKEIALLSSIYEAWRAGENYEDRPGLWRAAPMSEIESLKFNLNPGRYVEHLEEEVVESFDDAFARLSGELEDLFAATDTLQAELVDRLEGLRE